MTDRILTQDELRNKFTYNPETGIFLYIPAKRNNRKKMEAGFYCSSGYLCIGIKGKYYKLHRLAFLYMNGKIPEKSVDHINGIRDDNRWENLREATSFENCQNIKLYSSNSTGFMGVTYYKNIKKFAAQIQFNKKNKYLGLFNTAEQAHAVYLEQKILLHTFNPIPRHLHPA